VAGAELLMTSAALLSTTTDVYDLGTSGYWYHNVYAQKYYVDAVTAYIDLSSTTLRLNGPSYVGLCVGGGAVVFCSATAVYGSADNTIALGAPGTRFSAVYAYDAHFYDDVIIDSDLLVSGVPSLGTYQARGAESPNWTGYLIVKDKNGNTRYLMIVPAP